MFLDLEDYKPDTPHLPQAFSMREGVLASLLVHALLVIAYLVRPPVSEQETAAAAAVIQPQKDPVQFVHMVPTVERRATPRPQVEMSDLDRRAATPVKPPDPKNTAPFSVGDTPEKVVGGRVEKPAGAETGTAPPNTSAAPPDLASKGEKPPPVAPSPPAGGGLSSSLRNLSRYLQDQNFDNQQGGLGDQLPDIQFDSKGVEFGPWLRRFVAEVKRNWYIPQSAMALSGKVVIQFFVLKNGTITELKVVGPSSIEAYNVSAFNALKRSNPTQPLPPEYPDDRAFFTVTFHYEIRDGSSPFAGVAVPVP